MMIISETPPSILLPAVLLPGRSSFHYNNSLVLERSGGMHSSAPLRSSFLGKFNSRGCIFIGGTWEIYCHSFAWNFLLK